MTITSAPMSDQELSSLFEVPPADAPPQRHYVLVDPTGLTELPAWLRRSPRPASNLFRLEGEQSAEPVSPLLMPWQPAADGSGWREFERRIAQASRTSASVLWLCSPLSQTELAQRLARRISARLPDELDVVLRFFDSRVFAALVEHLPAAVREAFLGPATQWVLRDRRGELCRIASRFDAVDRLAAPLELDARTETALIDASEPDQIAQLLEQTAPQAYLGLPFEQRYDFILVQSAQAAALGIDSVLERSLYCALALAHGPDFAMQDPWKTRLDMVASGKASLEDLILSAQSDES